MVGVSLPVVGLVYVAVWLVKAAARNYSKRMDRFEKYESDLVDRLVELCTSKGLMDGILLSSPDITARWEPIALEYSGDAVREFNTYPEVVLAWTAYIGMAVACWWDKDWVRYKEQGYQSLVGSRGFDDLDEHITRDILRHPLNSKEAKDIAAILAFLAGDAYSFMMRQGVESMSVDAFNVFRHTLSAMYRIGASLELKSLRYKMEMI